jgi:quercetin dioxygenase-like cupin family protein
MVKVLDVESVRGFDPNKMQKTNLVDTPHLFCDVYVLCPGQSQKVHRHVGADKLYYVLEGSGTFTIGDETQLVGAGSLVPALANKDHGVHNEGPDLLRLLVTMAPNPNVGKETMTQA